MGIFDRFRTKGKEHNRESKRNRSDGPGDRIKLTWRLMPTFGNWTRKMAKITRPDYVESRNPRNDKKITVNENDIESLYDKGVRLDGHRKFREAIEFYDKVLRLDPNHYFALDRKGGSLLELKEVEQGISTLNKAISLKPEMYIARFNRICAYYATKNIEKVLSELEELHRIHPEDQATKQFIEKIKQHM